MGYFQPCNCTWGSCQAAEEINNTLVYKYGSKNLPLGLQTKCEALTAMHKCYLNQVPSQCTFYIILQFASLLVPSGTHKTETVNKWEMTYSSENYTICQQQHCCNSEPACVCITAYPPVYIPVVKQVIVRKMSIAKQEWKMYNH